MRNLIRFTIFLMMMCSLTCHSKDVTNNIFLVLKFENVSNNRDYSWLSRGLPQMILTDLSKTKLKITHDFDLADVTVSGSYVIIQERIRINCQLIETKTSCIITSSEITGYLDNILDLEKGLVFKLLDNLHIQISPDSERLILQLETKSLKALEYNYRGLDAIENNQKELAINLFEKANSLDMEYSSAKNNLIKYKKIISMPTSNVSSIEDSKKIIDSLVKQIVKRGFIITHGDLMTVADYTAFDISRFRMEIQLEFRKEVKELLLNTVKKLNGSRLSCDSGIKQGDYYTLTKTSFDTGLNKYFAESLEKLRVDICFFDKNKTKLFETALPLAGVITNTELPFILGINPYSLEETVFYVSDKPIGTFVVDFSLSKGQPHKIEQIAINILN